MRLNVTKMASDATYEFQLRACDPDMCSQPSRVSVAPSEF